MNLVNDIMRLKGGVIWSVSPQATAYEALELMARQNIGAVVVLDGESLVGIFSERDYARKVVLRGRSSRETKVSDLMTRKVFYVKPESTADECLHLMSSHHIRHLPVMDGARLAGIISVGDVVKTILRDRDFQIQQLENYITGPGYPGDTQHG